MTEKAVSPIVGFIMILAILIGVMAIIQSIYVPEWCKQIEGKSFEILSSQASKIPEILTSSSSTTIILKTGMSYQKYPFLYTPPPTAGYLEFIPEKVKINGTIAGTNKIFNRNLTTSAIYINPTYIYSSNRSILVEYTAVFEDYEYSKVVLVNQSAFSKTTAVIPIVFSNRTVISGVNIPLNFYLISKSAGIPLTNVNISIETKNPVYWENILSNIYGISNVSLNGSNVAFRATSLTVYLPCWSVSTVKTTSTLKRYIYAIIPLNSKVYLSVGNTIPVSFMVVDQFGNPYFGVNVSSRLIYGSTNVSVLPSNTTTNIQGVATFYVTGLNSGNATLEVLSGNASVNITITVLPSPTPTSTPVPASVEFVSGENNLTLLSFNTLNNTYSAILNASIEVLDLNGNPVAGVPVIISLNVLYYKGGGGILVGSSTAYTKVVVTNNNGIAKITNEPITVPISTTLFYKYAYTQLSATCAGISTSYTNYTSPIAGYFGGGIVPISTPYTITYP